MGLLAATLGRAAAPFRGLRLARRFLVELRGIRRALERQADVLELAQGAPSRESLHAQVFRSMSRTKEDLSDKQVKDLTEVSYVDEALLSAMLAKEGELTSLLGRAPTEEEIERAYRGDVE